MGFIFYRKIKDLITYKTITNRPTMPQKITSNWLSKVGDTKTHNLWHCPIGVSHYKNLPKGDKVGEYALHYIKGDNLMKLVAMSLAC